MGLGQSPGRGGRGAEVPNNFGEGSAQGPQWVQGKALVGGPGDLLHSRKYLQPKKLVKPLLLYILKNLVIKVFIQT